MSNDKQTNWSKVADEMRLGVGNKDVDESLQSLLNTNSVKNSRAAALLNANPCPASFKSFEGKRFKFTINTVSEDHKLQYNVAIEFTTTEYSPKARMLVEVIGVGADNKIVKANIHPIVDYDNNWKIGRINVYGDDTSDKVFIETWKTELVDTKITLTIGKNTYSPKGRNILGVILTRAYAKHNYMWWKDQKATKVETLDKTTSKAIDKLFEPNNNNLGVV